MYEIQNQAEQLRPRERLQALGADKLSNHELLAILLRTGTKEMPVHDVSMQIINQMTSLADFKHLSLQELQQIKGIGKVKSIELKAMIELARRIQDSEYKRADQILSSQQLARRMMLELSDSKQEHLIALYLDTQNRIIEQKTIFIGTVRRSVAEPREISIMPVKIWQRVSSSCTITPQAVPHQAKMTKSSLKKSKQPAR